METNLQRIRKGKGWTQEKLAREAGISKRVLQNYEQRTRDINGAAAVTVYRLANALECGYAEILEINDINTNNCV